MHAGEVMMKDPVCCSRTTSVMSAARIMRECDIGFVPVVDELWTRHLMGVVTDRDLCPNLAVGHAGRRVDAHQVLNVRRCADFDEPDVASKYRAVPNVGARPEQRAADFLDAFRSQIQYLCLAFVQRGTGCGKEPP